jgi:hypothetical protein
VPSRSWSYNVEPGRGPIRHKPEFFAAHTISELWNWPDFDLENEGRLTHPMVYDQATDRYLPKNSGMNTAIKDSVTRQRQLSGPNGRLLSSPTSQCRHVGRMPTSAMKLWKLPAQRSQTLACTTKAHAENSGLRPPPCGEFSLRSPKGCPTVRNATNRNHNRPGDADFSERGAR